MKTIQPTTKTLICIKPYGKRTHWQRDKRTYYGLELYMIWLCCFVFMLVLRNQSLKLTKADDDLSASLYAWIFVGAAFPAT